MNYYLNLINKALSLLFVFAVGVFPLYAENNFNEQNYRKFIQTVTFSSYGDQIVGTLQLNDGTVWSFSEAYIIADDIANYLHQNNEVSISTGYQAAFYQLTAKNDRGYSRTYVLRMAKESQDLLPRIEKISKTMIEEAGWFKPAQYKYQMSLTDGSVWEANSCGYKLDKWMEGDRVYICKTYKGHLNLIDTDATDNGHDSRIILHSDYKSKWVNVTGPLN